MASSFRGRLSTSGVASVTIVHDRWVVHGRWVLSCGLNGASADADRRSRWNARLPAGTTGLAGHGLLPHAACPSEHSAHDLWRAGAAVLSSDKLTRCLAAPGNTSARCDRRSWLAQEGGVVALGMHRVSGHDRPFEVEFGQQRLEFGDLVGLVVDLALGHNDAFLVAQSGEGVHWPAVSLDRAAPALPSTAIASAWLSTRPACAWSASQTPTVASSASGSTRWSAGRSVASCGAMYWLVTGWRLALRRARTSWSSSAAYSPDREGSGVDLRGAELAGASLVGMRFDDADFRGSDLTGADLSGGRFRGADFRGAILDGVKWADADCAGAEFDASAGPPAHAEKEPFALHGAGRTGVDRHRTANRIATAGKPKPATSPDRPTSSTTRDHRPSGPG